MNHALEKRILRMVDEDQKMRMTGRIDRRVDIKLSASLKSIIKKFGWPDQALVGEKGANGAWLIAQHADHDLAFQKKCLVLIRQALKHGTVSRKNFAYLLDRVNVNSGKRQRYGTQMRLNKKGKLVPAPIGDRKGLDARRAAIGLGSFKEYSARLQKTQEELNKKAART